MGQDIAREELWTNFKRSDELRCEERWQRRLERQKALHSDDVALADSCYHESWESYWRRIDIRQMFRDLMYIWNRNRIEN